MPLSTRTQTALETIRDIRNTADTGGNPELYLLVVAILQVAEALYHVRDEIETLGETLNPH